MNKFLSDILGLLNGLFALTLIGIGYLFGYFVWPAAYPELSFDPKLYGVFGAICGLLLAVVVCGLIAVMIDIRNVLRRILRKIEEDYSLPQSKENLKERIEPNLSKSEI